MTVGRRQENATAASKYRGGYEFSTKTFRTGELLSQRTRVESIKIDCHRWDFTPTPVLHWQVGPTTGGWRSSPEAQPHPKFVLKCKTGRGLGQNLNFRAN